MSLIKTQLTPSIRAQLTQAQIKPSEMVDFLVERWEQEGLY
ncbi:hypothetical protein DCAR_0104257 [Daucus carota subsp. sativus]|uniref:Uncharacterized protein n=1 Tax=Daucus carota subsp. sativus TaxID=79200 RepID=A0AAF0W867_DAUCS|nr:hypothetical protein DCAR_0104257 [Daucus carota subsp. sativus]